MTAATDVPEHARELFLRLARSYEREDDDPDEPFATFYRKLAGEAPEGWYLEDAFGDYSLDELRVIPGQLSRAFIDCAYREDEESAAWVRTIGLAVESWLMETFPEYAAEARFRAGLDEADGENGGEG